MRTNRTPDEKRQKEDCRVDVVGTREKERKKRGGGAWGKTMESV